MTSTHGFLPTLYLSHLLNFSISHGQHMETPPWGAIPTPLILSAVLSRLSAKTTTSQIKESLVHALAERESV